MRDTTLLVFRNGAHIVTLCETNDEKGGIKANEQEFDSDLEVPNEDAPPTLAGKKIGDVIRLAECGFHSRMRSTPHSRRFLFPGTCLG